MKKIHFISRSPAVTLALGETWGKEVTDGMLIGLTGELGAGKTHLVKGLARGMGISARIASPTFVLINEYKDGRLPLAHLDLYRLETDVQVMGAGLEDYIVDPKGVVVVEWIERWAGPDSKKIKRRKIRYRHVTIEPMDSDERLIIYEDFGL